MACVAAVVVVTEVYLMWSTFPNSSMPTKGVAVLSIFTLVVGFGFVPRLRVGAAAFQARELASPSPQFLYRNRFHVRTLELDLESPDVVYKWPDGVRDAIKVFLEDEKRRTAIRR